MPATRVPPSAFAACAGSPASPARGAEIDASPPAARAIALDLLGAVLGQGRFLDAALADHSGLDCLAARDRAFCRQLTTTVLRRLGQIDALIDGCLERPLPPAAATPRNALRLGTAQLLFLAVAPHAAVGETVGLAGGRYKGLVNAVLRRLTREGPALAAAQDAARLNTPDWLWRSWSAAYGEPTCRAIAEAHLASPPLDITVKADPDGWAARLAAERLPTGGLRRTDGGPVTTLPGYDEGAWWVQDAAAALPARLLGPLAGKTVIELCAAPGGKTAQLAAGGAQVIAVDRSAARLRRLEANLARLGLAAETVAADATAWRPAAPADAVLIDAPCSGTGNIRRHPDLQRLKGPADVTRMAAAQDRLLAAGLDMVRPGGVVLFCTCSLEPAEGPGRLAALLATGAPVAAAPIGAAEIGGLGELVGADGMLRTLPCHLAARGGMDGFYAARLQRR